MLNLRRPSPAERGLASAGAQITPVRSGQRQPVDAPADRQRVPQAHGLRLAGGLPGCEVALPQVLRPPVVGNLQRAADPPDGPEQRRVHAGTGDRAAGPARQDQRGPLGPRTPRYDLPFTGTFASMPWQGASFRSAEAMGHSADHRRSLTVSDRLTNRLISSLARVCT